MRIHRGIFSRNKNSNTYMHVSTAGFLGKRHISYAVLTITYYCCLHIENYSCSIYNRCDMEFYWFLWAFTHLFTYCWRVQPSPLANMYECAHKNWEHLIYEMKHNAPYLNTMFLPSIVVWLIGAPVGISERSAIHPLECSGIFQIIQSNPNLS